MAIRGMIRNGERIFGQPFVHSRQALRAFIEEKAAIRTIAEQRGFHDLLQEG